MPLRTGKVRDRRGKVGSGLLRNGQTGEPTVRKTFISVRLCSLVILGVVASCVSGAQTPAVANLTGDWIATFGDSTSAGTLALHMTQDVAGHVSGSYTSTLGGAGLVTGSVSEGMLSATLAQTQSQCPGSY